jgi:hypothetical protein
MILSGFSAVTRCGFEQQPLAIQFERAMLDPFDGAKPEAFVHYVYARHHRASIERGILAIAAALDRTKSPRVIEPQRL